MAVTGGGAMAVSSGGVATSWCAGGGSQPLLVLRGPGRLAFLCHPPSSFGTVLPGTPVIQAAVTAVLLTTAGEAQLLDNTAAESDAAHLVRVEIYRGQETASKHLPYRKHFHYLTLKLALQDSKMSTCYVSITYTK